MTRIFHTADLHIGLKFTRASYSPDLREKLVAARVDTLTRLVEKANDEHCELFVVAGDMFDHLRVTQTVIRKSAEALRRFAGVVVVLPGNHDFCQRSDDPVWPHMENALGEGHLILREQRPYDLSDQGIPVVLYPGPCGSKHSSDNAVGWIRSISPESRDESKFHIGIAHGSLDGVSPDFDGRYFPMTHRELEAMGLDLWLLGHTHIRYPDQLEGSGNRLFYPSTPEPDGFDCRHEGFAWIIDLSRSQPAQYRSLATGQYRFHDFDRQLLQKSDVLALQRELNGLAAGNQLVKLRLHGQLSDQLLADLRDALSSCQPAFGYFEPDTTDVIQEITQVDIDREFTQGSFPHRLLSQLAANQPASLALQLAYELVQEAQQ
ncbi:MAG: DNA repair exonuclease [Planctomycetaceae bacterium]|nr:DNA repair exonuclease [Planctomycetaceae bacterium]